MKHRLLILLLATAHLPAQAQFTTSLPAADSIAPGPLTVYGYLDAYYSYDIKHVETNSRPGFLYSHNRQNEFSVNQGLVGLRYDNGQVRGTLALQAGSYVEANYTKESPTFRHLYEAYAGFRPFKKAWLDAGIFTSHLGFESAVSEDNWTLTRSIMAENSPYYETGVRLSYEASPKLTLTILGLNGWQNIRETNQQKALGTQVQWKPSPKLLVNSSAFLGNEQPSGRAARQRYFHNFYLTYALTGHWSVAGVFDVGKQAAADEGRYDTWHAASAFVRCQLAAKWVAAARAEYYYADRGVIINTISPGPGEADFKAGGGSLNLDYAPATNVLLRLEGRYLRGQAPVFERPDNPTANSYGNLTSSLAISF
ncbi:porin [Hymenobacter sp. BT664]|uniref:Porin n=1 Tax=Hymenobacter montanus TaxID=2771359 RepID=A0A927GII0_9BACT|nr:outer membrane beta-barrel protein [Hymenobacter montanus]MBD2767468.1 porin [Hymenobacter montanus]